ncbi:MULTISPECIES: hypothetical protein [Corynebacterium]|uniref:hypothetical protein n=1 Tax=Corynebacterium TaxID=1716 RepID=UPI0008A5BE24|nr:MULTISPECIES: hypothetical protein [Corynebacterium]MDK6813471.1 hypothetical protein [Corynebacterium sp. UMB6689]OFQ35378.1 hypothetical protein HMPREF2943_11390 [Corynebacterium sp. HMSC072D12]OFT67862.1 hypothetical protein HMPREF3147_00430 [Corynebacterium sp. HMSC05D03]QQU96237.1 hypothetical protein I6I66_03790 [Corynebacterium aurimucosum]UTA70871.1 hypothetical protein J3S22_08875 [Corynebacterium aurimucosum]
MRLFSARPTAAAGAAVLLAAGTLLSACGSATVDEGDATETSVAPLERSSVASGESSASKASESSASASAERTPGEEPEDRGAREISEIPTPAPAQGPDQDFLAAVAEKGVNIDGVEDQLVGAAQASCQGDAVTVPAVAGQLIEQGRTELSHEDVVQLITEQGNKLCAQ